MSRPLAEVLLDLDRAVAVRNEADKLCQESPSNDSLSDRYAEADDALDTLREEFRAVFRSVTGVQWANVEALQMSGAL